MLNVLVLNLWAISYQWLYSTIHQKAFVFTQIMSSEALRSNSSQTFSADHNTYAADRVPIKKWVLIQLKLKQLFCMMQK